MRGSVKSNMRVRSDTTESQITRRAIQMGNLWEGLAKRSSRYAEAASQYRRRYQRRIGLPRTEITPLGRANAELQRHPETRSRTIDAEGLQVVPSPISRVEDFLHPPAVRRSTDSLLRR